MKVLVTGGAGFVGHHVVRTLLSDTDWDVVCLERLSFSGNLNRLSEIIADEPETKNRVKIVYHNLAYEINTLVSSMIGDVDYILHLAAGSHVDRSIQDPRQFVQSNIIGTLNVLEFARTCKSLKKMIYFSTDEVFGQGVENYLFDEYDRYNSRSPYAASKAGAEELCVAYKNTFNVPVMITHASNIFGIRQHPEKFIPMTVKKILNGKEIIIHSDETLTKSSKRHYISVDDITSALMFILDLDMNIPYKNKDFNIHKFNITTTEEISNLHLATEIYFWMNVNPNIKMVANPPNRPGVDLSYGLSNEYLKSLGWEAKHSSIVDIQDVVLWYKYNKHWL